MKFILSLLINIFVFIIQILAPLMTFVFLIITFFTYSKSLIIIFNVSAVLYIIGYFTSTLAVKKYTNPIDKLPLFRTRPALSTLLEMSIAFVPSLIISSIICFILKDFTFYLRYVIIINWSSRIIIYLIKLFVKSKRRKKSIEFDNYINDFFIEDIHLDDEQDYYNQNDSVNAFNFNEPYDE